MTKTRSRLISILFFAAVILVFFSLCIGFAALQDDLAINGNMSVDTNITVLSKKKFRDALKTKPDVTQIYVGSLDELSASNLSLDDMEFVADVSDAEQGFGNSIGLYVLDNVAYVLASENSAVTFPEDSSYVFASNTLIGESTVDDVVACMKNVTSIEFGNVDFSKVDMGDVLSMYRMFYHCEALKSIEMPDSVKIVAQAMFRGCYELESVKISEDITRIGEVAFGDCHKLKRINEPNTDVVRCNIPAGVTSIGKGAFIWCSVIENVNVPDGVTVIEDELFCGCYVLDNVTLPSGVTRIGDYAFRACYALKAMNIPNSVKSIGNSAFTNCSGLTGVVIGNSVEDIGELAFFDCYNLPQITIPSSVRSIGKHAFKNCGGLTSVDFEYGVETIGNLAFNDCWQLSKITIPDSVTSIENDAFNGCPIAEATLPACAAKAVNNIDFDKLDDSTNNNSHLKKIVITMGEIESKALARCGALTDVTIQDRVTGIGDQAFYNCYGLSKITIPHSVKSIGVSAFSGCGALIDITIENGVETVGKLAFSGCWQLPKITLPDSVTSIESDTFNGCPIADATIPACAAVSVKSAYLKNVVITSGNAIVDSAFAECWALETITIPSSVKSIGANALYNCGKLGQITFRGTQTQWESIVKGVQWDAYAGAYTVVYTP